MATRVDESGCISGRRGIIRLASMVMPTRLRGPRARATARMLMRLGLLGIGLGASMLGGSRVPAIAGEAKIELLGAGWPTRTITYFIEAGAGVARPAIEDVREAVEDWNIALALTNLSNGQVIQFVPAAGARRDIVISLEIAPGPVGGRVFRRTLRPFRCELAGARVELRGESLGGPERGVGTRNVARHALGHVLGLGHSDDPGSIMRLSGDTAPGFRNDVAIQECEASRLWMLHPPIECPLPPLTLCY